ncbi:SDR family NAD(P)-dependent oxidoreductase [Nocardia sp. NPDC050175]|uniref:SDR family NAD(P)-dependent oxidoreductase n=1 Tax=Nocardia sp. NPDC050175 TaxID=3364317 RepID=UPI00379A129A
MNHSKIALITGASRGFGRSMTTHLTQAGISVIGTYHRDADEAMKLTAEVEGNGGKLTFLHFDAARHDLIPDFVQSVSGVLSDWGSHRLDYLINNAGIGYFTPFAATTEEQFDELVAVNLKAPYFLTQRLLPLLNDGGRILNLSTALTKRVVPTGSAYAATKGAVEVLTRYLAVELADRGIRVNTLQGGATDGDFGGGIMRTEHVRELAVKTIALGRMGTANDLAAAVPALLSAEFGWATGSLIELNGGQSL